jgi:cell division protein FtsQ
LLVHKKTRKNFYKNSAAKRRAKRIQYALSLLKIIFGLSLVAVMSFAFIFAYDLFTQSGYFKTVRLDVQGCNTLDEKAVITQAKLSYGINIFSVNLGTTRKRLLAHPWISDAEVSREIPSGICIRIKEHKPLAIIDINRKFLLNTQGDIFKKWEASDPVNLPVVDGLAFSDLNVGARPDSRAFNAVMTVLKLGQRKDSVLSNKEIRKIEVDKDIGLTIYADTGFGALKLGYDDYPGKYKRLQEVLFYLKKNQNIPILNSIDLNNPNRIVVNLNLEKQPATGHKEV